MKRRLSQWILFTGIVCISSLMATILFERATIDVADSLFGPWFAICSAVTPIQWQFRGNTLLNLAWIISGVVVYSMLISVVCLSVVNRPGRSNKKVPSKTTKRSWWVLPLISLVAGPVIAAAFCAADVFVLNPEVYPTVFEGDALATLTRITILGTFVGVVVAIVLAIASLITRPRTDV